MKYELDQKRFIRDVELMQSLKMDENAKPAMHFFRELIWTFFGQGGMEVLDWWLWADETGEEKILRSGTLCDWWGRGVNHENEVIADLSSIESLYEYVSEKHGKNQKQLQYDTGRKEYDMQDIEKGNRLRTNGSE